MDVQIVITRTECKYYTEGTLVLNIDGYNSFECETLELPYKNNYQKISSIPKGLYSAQIYKSPKHGWCVSLPFVRNRSNIRIHSGNKIQDTQGCILVGYKSTDGYLTDSRIVLHMIIKRIQSVMLKHKKVNISIVIQ